MTKAHCQKQRAAEYLAYFPAHEPRSHDSHRALFEHARSRLAGSGVGCWICGSRQKLEAHHAQVELAAAQGIDFRALCRMFPQYHLDSQEAFLAWVQGEGNLLILCARHHRHPIFGIHSLPYPSWVLQGMWKADLPPPVMPVEATR